MLFQRTFHALFFVANIARMAAGMIQFAPNLGKTYETCKLIGANGTQLFSLFGFNGNDGKAILTRILSGGNYGFDGNIVLASVNTPEELFKMRNTAVSIGYVDESDVLIEGNNLLANIMAVLGNSNIPDKPKKVVFLLRGKNEASAENAKIILLQLVEDVRQMLKKIYGPVGFNEKKQEIVVHLLVGDALDYDLNAILQPLKGTFILPGIEWIQYMDLKTKVSADPMNTFEISAAAECFGLVDSLMVDVSASLSSLSQTITTPSFLISNVALENLELVVTGAIQKNFEKYQSTYAQYGASKSMVHASYVARTRIASALYPFFKRLVDATFGASIESFEKGLRRIPPDSRLVQRLRNHAASTQKGLISKMNIYKKGFRSICEKTTENGLFSSQLYSKLGLVGLSTSSLSETFSSGREVRSLQMRLSEACADRERLLFLQGSYNPYVRDLPVPPIHFNFNYLVDPRAMAFNREFEKLYDEHKDGVALNRAAALQLPGLTGVAFDPNDHPVPNENKPWWRVLFDYYVNDKF